MKIKKEESKIKPEFKLASDYIDLRTLDTNMIIDHLDEQIKLRAMPLEKHIKKSLKK